MPAERENSRCLALRGAWVAWLDPAENPTA
jgi:hypothetical protein